MNAQLAAIVEGLESAQRRLHVLGQTLSDGDWSRRPGPDRWSPLECVAHLNLTALAMLPLIRDGLARARSDGRPAPRRYRRDALGWLLVQALNKPGKFKVRTTAAFVPTADRPVSEVLAEFDSLQGEQVACVRAADGLPVDRVRIASPFNARIRYTVYSALSILPVHQHRPLWQAEHG